jgi:hypothetical protein
VTASSVEFQWASKLHFSKSLHRIAERYTYLFLLNSLLVRVKYVRCAHGTAWLYAPCLVGIRRSLSSSSINDVSRKMREPSTIPPNLYQPIVMCLTSCACLTNPCSWFGRPYGSSGSEAHDYIYSVLERGDHGRNRHIDCDRATLNDAIQQHAERIGTPDLYV